MPIAAIRFHNRFMKDIMHSQRRRKLKSISNLINGMGNLKKTDPFWHEFGCTRKPKLYVLKFYSA